MAVEEQVMQTQAYSSLFLGCMLLLTYWGSGLSMFVSSALLGAISLVLALIGLYFFAKAYKLAKKVAGKAFWLGKFQDE